MSDENQRYLDQAWAQHRASLREVKPRVRPIRWAIGWTIGLPVLVGIVDDSTTAWSVIWWGAFGHLLASSWFGYWREKALAGCYMRMSDAFADYVIEMDDLTGALVWQSALADHKRRLKTLAVPFPTIRDRDDASDREVGF